MSIEFIQKPVKLQFNAGGAWRDVLRFDAGNDAECAEVMEAAERLAKVARATMRVVMENSPHPRAPEVLLHWSERTGWEKR